MSKILLNVENLTMKFGGLTAIDDLSFSANNNEITSRLKLESCQSAELGKL